jgi:hypothetical protein
MRRNFCFSSAADVSVSAEDVEGLRELGWADDGGERAAKGTATADAEDSRSTVMQGGETAASGGALGSLAEAGIGPVTREDAGLGVDNSCCPFLGAPPRFTANFRWAGSRNSLVLLDCTACVASCCEECRSQNAINTMAPMMIETSALVPPKASDMTSGSMRDKTKLFTVNYGKSLGN